MKSLDLPPVAIIADAHLHDIHGDYDGASVAINGRNLTLRSWADNRRSSRVFNESHMALMGALGDIVKRNIKHVVLLGDYADDGQIEAVQRVVNILRDFKKDHGINFYALPGNHDYYGPVGKHQSTRFAISSQQSVLVTSDPEIAENEPGSAVLTRKMFCLGAPEGLLPMAEFGFFHQPDYLHWETPFGTSDAVDERCYSAKSSDGSTTHQLMDASYLVEPSKGLWLLMLDANVFEPRNGTWNIHQKKAFIDSSDAGWNSVLASKPYLLNWISDVCRRASEQGKHLLTFSHYPVLDVYNDKNNSYEKLFGKTGVSRRRPKLVVAEKLLETGLQLHFGGHMHVNGISRYSSDDRQLTQVSVPSPVNCPAAYQMVSIDKNKVQIDTISLASLTIDPSLTAFYKQECQSNNEPIDPALNASNYGEFLYQRIQSRVQYGYFKKYWPNNIVRCIKDTSVADLLMLFHLQTTSSEPQLLCATDTLINTDECRHIRALITQHQLAADDFIELPLMELIVDWYCLRDAADQAQEFITPKRIKLYRFIASYYGDATVVELNNTTDFFTVFLGAMHASLETLSQTPSRTTVSIT